MAFATQPMHLQCVKALATRSRAVVSLKTSAPLCENDEGDRVAECRGAAIYLELRLFGLTQPSHSSRRTFCHPFVEKGSKAMLHWYDGSSIRTEAWREGEALM